MRFEFLPTPFLTTSTTRMAPVGGGLAIVETMGKAARGLGVEFHFETTARSLVAGPAGVGGVLADTPRRPGQLRWPGRPRPRRLPGQRRDDGALPRRPRPHDAPGRPRRQLQQGRGHRDGTGRRRRHRRQLLALPRRARRPALGEPEAAIFCFPYGILVNAEGERFVDEARGPIDAWYERTTRDIQAQTGGIAWVVLDQQAPRRAQRPLRDPHRPAAGRRGAPSPSWRPARGPRGPARGDGRGVRRRLPATATSTRGPPTGWPPPAWRRRSPTGRGRSAEGPFEAYPVMAANVFTFGGLKTTAAAEVVDRDGARSPGCGPPAR